MYNDTTTSYSISDKEYAYNVNKPTYKEPGTIQMYIPKLMANIGIGLPTTSRGSINRSIFENDKGCGISCGTTITTQNFITIPKWNNEHPEFPDKIDQPNYPQMIRYSKFVVEILNADIRNIHYTGKV